MTASQYLLLFIENQYLPRTVVKITICQERLSKSIFAKDGCQNQYFPRTFVKINIFQGRLLNLIFCKDSYQHQCEEQSGVHLHTSIEEHYLTINSYFIDDRV